MQTDSLNFNEVVLVDQEDNPLGTMDKLKAHQLGELHRAFSIFLFNDKDEMLIQKRAAHKYHSPNLWTNSCCSHPAFGESLMDAGKRRLAQEINLKTEIQPLFSFIYKASLDNQLNEHELDHVFVGRTNAIGKVNFEEVSELKFIGMTELSLEIEQRPEQFTIWFRIIMTGHLDKILKFLNTPKQTHA